MRKSWFLVLAALVLFVLSASANAGVVVQEQFIYTSGANINTQNGGNGFNGSWISNASSDGKIYDIQSTGLS